ncbi:hypothetical protein [Streptomyces sp. IBSBF 3010]|uniref:hypothetical protein n=1 Tax=Streptomyces sp. IBSBF 3010 TaxID=2903526 RepID=UPI002FDBF9C3
MANYTLTNGYTVTTSDAPGGGTEFVTKCPAGDVISSVTFHGMDAAELERDLIVANRLAAMA